MGQTILVEEVGWRFWNPRARKAGGTPSYLRRQATHHKKRFLGCRSLNHGMDGLPLVVLHCVSESNGGENEGRRQILSPPEGLVEALLAASSQPGDLSFGCLFLREQTLRTI